jgi:hypothetical protein
MAAEAQSAYGQRPGLSMARRNGPLHVAVALKSPYAHFLAKDIFVLFS